MNVLIRLNTNVHVHVHHTQHTEHDNVKVYEVVSTQPVESCLVAEQRVLEASQLTDVILINEDVTTLNVTEKGETPTVEEQHSLTKKIHIH